MKNRSKRGEANSLLFQGKICQGEESSLNDQLRTIWTVVLQLVVGVTLLSRGYLILRWGSHVRGLLWNEESMSPIVEGLLGGDWQQYVAHSDQAITVLTQGIGVGLMLAGLLACFAFSRLRALLLIVLPLASVIMLIDTWSSYVDVHHQLGMLVEHALQVGVPLLLWLNLVWPFKDRVAGWFACFLVFCCFAGHGLYAADFHPVPAHFINMTMAILPLDEDGARSFLMLAGWLDFVVACVVLWIPPLRKLGLYYMIFWGAVTALARPYVFCSASLDWYGLDRWGAELLVRSSHWAVPFLILLLLPRKGMQDRLNLKLMKLGSVTQRIMSRS